MWDCTVTSPRGESTPVSIPMSPRKRDKGESCWGHFVASCTPVELQQNPVRDWADSRDVRIVGGKIECKLCIGTRKEGILRTVLGHDQHYRVEHEGLEMYTSFTSEESEMGGRRNPNVPKGRDAHRAALLKELHALGVTAKELDNEGYELEELRDAGYTTKEIYGFGKYTLADLKEAGVTRHLKEAGLPLKELAQVGYTLAQLKKAGFTAKQLRSGVSANLADLRAAGYLLHELREAGFTLTEFKELKRPGGQLEPAFSLQALKKEGYTCKDLRKAGFTLAELKSGYTQADMKFVHYTSKAELAQDGFPLQELKLAGYAALDLKVCGFTNKDLLAVGFTKADIKG